ncbi:MAG: toll/interleukin-1 receptor domain-containing protein, partial [Nitrospirota bacterium]
LGLIAEPNSPVSLTLSPDPKGSGRWHSNGDEVEALLIQPLQPQRLFVFPHGVNRPAKSLERMGQPLLTVAGLRLGGDFFDVDLLGQAGVPIAAALGIWKWPLLMLINVPLLFFLSRDASRKLRRRPAFREPLPDDIERAATSGAPSGKLRIFMSYSWVDKERVEQIHDLLASKGADPWIDREDIRGGSEWELSIKEQMRGSQRVLIFISSASIQKAGFAWVEMRLAARIADEQPEGSNFVIPVRLDNCRLPDLLGRWHCIDLFEPDGEPKLLAALGLEPPEQGQAHSA